MRLAKRHVKGGNPVIRDEKETRINWKDLEFCMRHDWKPQEVSVYKDEYKYGNVRRRRQKTEKRTLPANKESVLNELIKSGLLSEKRKGNYDVVSTLTNSSLTPTLNRKPLYFTNREDAYIFAKKLISKRPSGSTPSEIDNFRFEKGRLIRNSIVVGYTGVVRIVGVVDYSQTISAPT
jgi:hypothetical protein